MVFDSSNELNIQHYSSNFGVEKQGIKRHGISRLVEIRIIPHTVPYKREFSPKSLTLSEDSKPQDISDGGTDSSSHWTALQRSRPGCTTEHGNPIRGVYPGWCSDGAGEQTAPLATVGQGHPLGGVPNASFHSPGGNGAVGTSQPGPRLRTPGAEARPQQPAGPHHPRPPGPRQARTRPNSRPAGPGRFRSPGSFPLRPRPNASAGVRPLRPVAESYPGKVCSPQSLSPTPGPFTHSPTG
ncbi:proline-rich proteoglycan 2-like [Tupaia chinensis]|uniref:proline-rich proteoglycan 2-like n=1 Tax=Tupaia chinensis TaxID=246437 RepID=UPI0007045134|nr:proline-rich proteoglycan 2-like [Tupaia chinensis]